MLRSKPVLLSVAALLGLVLLGGGGWIAYTYGKQKGATDPQAVAEVATSKIIEAVGVHMYLPDEVPTVATVTDLERLKGQPFFANAKLGHKVLIYTVAQKVILYDEEADKIVEVAPLNTAPPAI